MNVEDLAALDRLTEDSILKELQARMKQNQFQTFIGDILLVLNPNERQDIYGEEVSWQHFQIKHLINLFAVSSETRAEIKIWYSTSHLLSCW